MIKKDICCSLAHLRKRLNIGCYVHIKIGLIDKAVKANNAYIIWNRKSKFLYSFAGTRYTRICTAEKCCWFFLKSTKGFFYILINIRRIIFCADYIIFRIIRNSKLLQGINKSFFTLKNICIINMFFQTKEGNAAMPSLPEFIYRSFCSKIVICINPRKNLAFRTVCNYNARKFSEFYFINNLLGNLFKSNINNSINLLLLVWP